jgi:hypothetical protein
MAIAIPRKELDRLQGLVERDGSPKIELAPLSKVPAGLPPAWGALLAHPEPTKAVWDLWKPMLKDLPKTLKIFRNSLQGLGLLTTKNRPASLVYLYTRNKGAKAYAYRGFVPAPVQHPKAKALPAEFLKFYQVHDGWAYLTDLGVGPLPSSDWYPLSQDPKSPGSTFLAVFHNGGPASMGFDLTENPPLCYVVWADDKPKIVRNIWKEIDRWIAAQMDDVDPA